MLHRLIHNLRTKPKAARDHIALGAAGACTALLLLIWLVVTPNISESGQDMVATTGAFGTLLSTIKEHIGTMKSALPDEETVTQAIDSLENEPPVEVASTTVSASSTMSATTLSALSSSTASTTPSARTVQIATTSTTTETASND